QAGHANDGVHGGADFVAHRGQEGTFRLVGCFGSSPGLLYCFHGPYALGNIQIEGKNPDLPTFYHHWSHQNFHIDQAVISALPPGRTMNDLPSVGAGLVAAGFGMILRATHYFIQVAADYLSLAVAEQLLKSRVASHDIVLNISTDHCYRADVHQSLKILPLAVG